MATSSTTERRFAAEAWGMRDDAPPGCTGRAAARDGNRSARVLHGDRVGQGESLGSWAMDLCVAVSIGLELFENGAGRECRSIAVLAQVGKEDMA